MIKVSIIMQVWNEEKYIKFAINSVLAQTFTDWELIIVDDGSTDNSADIAEEYAAKDSRIRVFRQENQKNVGAKNNAIKMAQGEYILPFDADDRMLPKCVETLYNTIKDSKYGVVAPSFASFGLRNCFDDRFKPTWFNMHIRNAITNTSMFRKSDWEKYGGYDEKFKEGKEDYDFWMNFVSDRKKIYRVPEILFYFRVKSIDESRHKKAEKIKEKLLGIMFKKYPMMKIIRGINGIIGFKRTTKLNILRFMKIPILVLPRFGSKKYIKLDYFDGRPNFGDALNVPLVRDLFGFEVRKSKPKKCRAVFIGSRFSLFLGNKLNFWQNVRKCLRPFVKVWGTGIYEPEKKPLFAHRRFKIYALRGKITLERLKKYTGKKLENTILGDPGLLAARLIDTTKIEKKYDLGIILHLVDEGNSLVDKIKVPNAKIINIHLPPHDFMESVAECRNIVSSAMHGLIASDSLGIPSARLILSDKIVGGEYKFNDYYSVFDLDSHTKIDLNEIDEFNDLDFIKENYKIKQEQVETICNDLVQVFPYKNKKR